jgi:hypothetical protein
MPADPIHRVPVVIAGAGPAGLVTAATLAGHGVASLLVERNPGLSPLPRATAVSTRTMELLRSFGLEDEVRAGQLDLTATGAWAAETLASAEGTELPLGVADLAQAVPGWPRSASAPSWPPSTRTPTGSPWSCASRPPAPAAPSGPATWSAPTAPTRGCGASSASPWRAPTT